MAICLRNYLLAVLCLIGGASKCRSETRETIKTGQISLHFLNPSVVEVDLPSGASFRDFALVDPARIVIDFRDVSLDDRSSSKEFDGGPIRAIRFGSHQDFVRLVLEISQNQSADALPVYTINAQPSKLLIYLSAGGDQKPPLLAQTESSSALAAMQQEVPATQPTRSAMASRLTWNRNDLGLILHNSGETILTLDQCAVCTSSCADLPALELASGDEKGIEASIQARISCIVKDSTRSERLVITPQDGLSGEL